MITPRMVDTFDERLENHIFTVIILMSKLVGYCGLTEDDIMDRAVYHDEDKQSPRLKEAYIWLNAYHKAKRLNKKFSYPANVQKQVDRAIKLHIFNNRHHPEFHNNVNEMSNLDLVEMVCDWTSKDAELNGKPGNAYNFARQNVGNRWKFNAEKTGMIYEIIEILDTVAWEV